MGNAQRSGDTLHETRSTAAHFERCCLFQQWVHLLDPQTREAVEKLEEKNEKIKNK